MEASIQPPVVKWYRVYAIAMTVLYFLVSALFILAFFLRPDAKELNDMPAAFYYGYLTIMVLMCLVLFGAFLVSLFLKPKPWTWIYHMVLICLGLTSPCCLPASVPLLIYWIKPEVRSYFGRI